MAGGVPVYCAHMYPLHQFVRQETGKERDVELRDLGVMKMRGLIHVKRKE